MSGWLGETLVASTVLMLVVLALRAPVARLFGAQAAYALWLLPAIRMVLPPMPADVAPPAPVATFHVAVRRFVAAAEPVIDWRLVFTLVWLTGAISFLTLAVVAYRRFLERIGANRVAAGKRDGIPIFVSPAVDGPVAVGFVWPAIVLPADHAVRYAPAELDLAIRHEAAHHAHHDLAANLAALFVRAAHWFNPVAAIAHRAFRADQEMACDARVLAGHSAGERDAYARALVATASGPLGLPVCALNATGRLKRRMRMLGFRNSNSRRMAGAALAGTVIVTGLALTVSGGAAAETATAAAQQMRTVIRGENAERRVATRAELLADAAEARDEAREATAEAGEAARDAAADAANDASACDGRRAVRYRGRDGRSTRVILNCTPPVPAVPPVPVAALGPIAPPAPAAPFSPMPPVPPVAHIPSAAEIDAMVRDAMAEAQPAIAEARRIADACRTHRDGGCGYVDMREIHRTVALSLQEAREEIRRERDLSDRERAQALAGIDRAIARAERNSGRDAE
ncbi:MAG: hypothetical protein H0X36_06095 [Sphingomonadaceae bacterium]|nr:hypothetical protein [Sphingomonadaceae bacterium]